MYPSCPTYRASGIHLFLFISLTLKHFPKIPCIFQKKSVFLQKKSCTRQFESKLSLRSFAFSLQKKRYSPIMEICFSDMALPIHNFTYIQAYRAKSIKPRHPSWHILIHPSHDILHLIMYHLNFIEIPTNCFVMINSIAQATEFV